MKKINKSLSEKIHSNSRINYWNKDYLDYWRRRVDETHSPSVGSELVENDTKTSLDGFYHSCIDQLNIKSSDAVLELGCGYGRSLPKLLALSNRITAVDISDEMIKASSAMPGVEKVQFVVAPSEDLPLPSDFFNKIICFAAFDAMYQIEALKEMHRVSKFGAKILVTGKNIRYFPDDNLALQAELAARKKGHPNFFTDVQQLIRDLDHFGFKLIENLFFERRGDFGLKWTNNQNPDFFYEYLLVVEKVNEWSANESITYYKDKSTNT